MMNRPKHQKIMGEILRDIYSDTSITPLLGFKGGTCAYFFYDLPRFSVDLDFDLFENDDETRTRIFEKLKSILEKYGKIKDSYLKRFTIFLLLSYGDEDHNIKVEINARDMAPEIREYFELKEHLGIPILAGKKEYLFSTKLSALLMRKNPAMRDIYDVWFFMKNHWELDAELVKEGTGKTIEECFEQAIKNIEKVKDREILQKLGELLSDSQKDWVRDHLRKETIFMLKNELFALQKNHTKSNLN